MAPILSRPQCVNWRACGVQIDFVALNFEKAFDTVPQESVLGKLKFYGNDDSYNGWINTFLISRTQEVVVDGGQWDRLAVSSGVPQRTVL